MKTNAKKSDALTLNKETLRNLTVRSSVKTGVVVTNPPPRTNARSQCLPCQCPTATIY